MRHGASRELVNTELMAEDRGRFMASAAGLLVFGVRPQKFLPQSGISAAAYAGIEKDYAAKERAALPGPAVSLFPAPEAPTLYPSLAATFSEGGGIVEAGVIEQAIDFVRRNTGVSAWIDTGGQRQERWDYPLEAVREAIVNAVVHRDYTILVTDIEITVYGDRLEVISPGRLPNTVTVDKMRAGYRASRNELVKDVLRDYRYVEATGLGVPRKIVQGMLAHNGTEPDLIEEDDHFIVRLWKERRVG
jgi:ATP-dependent DNA helicase RecG